MQDQKTEQTSLPIIILLAIIIQVVWGHGRIGDVFFEGRLSGPDDYLRMYQVTSWLNGQDWFDLTAYRIGVEGTGFDIHWSRLVDIPIGLLISLFDLFLPYKRAANLATIVWPILLLTATIVVWTKICDRLIGHYNRLLPMLIVVLSVSSINQFGMGRIDHHNVQIFLFSLMILGFVSRETRWGDFLLGAAIALTVSVGLDTLPAVLIMLVVVGLEWAFGLDRTGRGMMRVGLAMIVTGPLLYAINFPPSHYWQAYCDANSLFYLGALVLVGTSFCVLKVVSPAFDSGRTATGFFKKGLAGAFLGGVSVVLLFAVFPDCLAGPYGAVSDEATVRWLDRVSEAKSLRVALEEYPNHWLATVGYLVAMLGIGAFVLSRPTHRSTKLITMYIVLLLFALGTVYQIRTLRTATLLTVPFCVILVNILYDSMKEQLKHKQGLLGSLQLILIFPLTSVAWYIAGALVFASAIKANQAPPAAVGPNNQELESGHCLEYSDYKFLRSLPTGFVVTDLSNSMAVLYHSKHRVFAGPYHRNEALILDTLDFFESDVAKAKSIAQEHGLTLVTFCMDVETADPADYGKEALATKILQNNPPAWLEEISPSGDRVRVFSITQ